MNKTNKETKLTKDQKAYVKKYAKQRGITVEQALEHEIIKNVIDWMELRDRGKQNVQSGEVR